MSETFVWVTQYVNLGKTHAEGLPQKWRLSDVATPQGWRYALGGAIGFVGPSPEKSIR